MSELDTLEVIDAAEPIKPVPKKRPWRWQRLITPLMGISVVLHIVLLFVPLPASNITPEETEEEAPETEDEEAPIDILSLSDIAAPEPPPEPPPEQPQQPQQQAPPPTGTPPPPDPEQIPETPVDEEEFIDDDLPIDDGFGDEGENPSSFDTAAATDQFVGDLSGLGVVDYTDEFGLPTPDLLRNPGNAACFIDPSGGPAPNVRVANWLDKEPQTLLRENLQDVYGPRGITFEELPAFCGERYFQSYSAEGEPFMTFSLVQLEGSTLLVIWQAPPQ